MMKINIFVFHIFLFRGEYTVPTIHLSLPESLYEELKKRADDMGVQITDLVKFYIRMGVKGSFDEDKDDRDDDKYSKMEENMIYLEARIAQLETLVSELMRKVSDNEAEDEEVEIINKDSK
ncbi:hypothetical protein [Stygiolobus caldivivus]|uniref:Uncharacterized protein n=1 Tax=Stygiolobus caldivivus TaxID=2824673 RepID=A0A8D5U5A5_9CREN|nr:hypothetical protein [Stygiolobus caldivivus]BCU69543.1 hypothetical protein KN1_08400 [Stygiolobus caldivivus]